MFTIENYVCQSISLLAVIRNCYEVVVRDTAALVMALKLFVGSNPFR